MTLPRLTLNGWRAARRAGAAAVRWRVRVVLAGAPLQCTSVLLSHGDHHLLVDTSFAQHDDQLIDGLRRNGVTPAQVSGIVITHFHLDHFGNNQLFPGAWVYGSRRDYEWAIPIYEALVAGERRLDVLRGFYPEIGAEEIRRMEEARVHQLVRWVWDPATLGDLGRYRWREETSWAIPGIEILPTPGHTPGHISVAVDGDDGRYLILGDARAFADEEAAGYDMPAFNSADYRRSRETIARFDGILIPGHDDPFSQSPAESEQPVSALEEVDLEG